MQLIKEVASHPPLGGHSFKELQGCFLCTSSFCMRLAGGGHWRSRSIVLWSSGALKMAAPFPALQLWQQKSGCAEKNHGTLHEGQAAPESSGIKKLLFRHPPIWDLPHHSDLWEHVEDHPSIEDIDSRVATGGFCNLCTGGCRCRSRCLPIRVGTWDCNVSK